MSLPGLESAARETAIAQTGTLCPEKSLRSQLTRDRGPETLRDLSSWGCVSTVRLWLPQKEVFGDQHRAIGKGSSARRPWALLGSLGHRDDLGQGES